MFHFNQFQRKTNEQIKSQYEEKQQFIPNNKIKISNKKEYLKQNKKKNPRYGSNLMPPWKLSETDLSNLGKEWLKWSAKNITTTNMKKNKQI